MTLTAGGQGIGNDVLARRRNGAGGGDDLELRPDPLRLKWTFTGLITADGHDARCTFECSVRAVDDPVERRMLREVLLDGRPHLSGEDVSAHFHPSLRAALTIEVEARSVTEVLTDAHRDAALRVLRDAAHRTAFACGLDILAPFHVEIDSPSFQQTRIREMQRTLAERNAAGQVEHLRRAADLLKQFHEMRQSAPDLSAGKVLQQLNPTDRGPVLQALLLGSAQQDRATDLWAVAGPYLVRIAGATNPPKPELIPLPPTLGPLRSVQASRVNDERVLLVGARSGFMVVRPDGPIEATLYHDPGVSSDLGFSRVVYWAETRTFVGCHGDAGIVRWGLNETATPRSTLRAERVRDAHGVNGAASLRNLHVLGPTRVAFSMGDKLVGMDDSGGPANTFTIPTASDAEIVGVVPDDLRLLVAHGDGTVCAIDRSTLDLVCKHRTGSRLRAAGALPWLGSTRLLLASEVDAAVRCVGLDDPLVTQYASGHRGARAVAGSHDRVAALSADRQKLVLWNAWDGTTPSAEVYLTGLTRHRVADIAFG